VESLTLDFQLSIFAVGIGILGLIAGVYIALRDSNNINQRLKSFIETPQAGLQQNPETSSSYWKQVRQQFNITFGVLNSEEMQRQLIAANWQITASEYFFIRVGAVAFSLFFGALIFQNIWPGIGLAVLAYVIPGFMLFRGIEIRQKKFQAQLIDSLTLIRGAVEAGYSFQQALNVVIQEIPAPTSEEFRRVRREVELGLPLNRALVNMANRMNSDDFYMVVTAVNINMQVGGSLSTILGVVIETIRQRIALLGELRSITSYARYASYMLTLLPFITAALIALVSPQYVQRLFEPGLTRYIMLYAIVSIFIGNIVLRRMSQFNI
jgi:tight adherence protein B